VTFWPGVLIGIGLMMIVDGVWLVVAAMVTANE
jgi:hypothetical protein